METMAVIDRKSKELINSSDLYLGSIDTEDSETNLPIRATMIPECLEKAQRQLKDLRNSIIVLETALGHSTNLIAEDMKVSSSQIKKIAKIYGYLDLNSKKKK